jgi:hypothetical protein
MARGPEATLLEARLGHSAYALCPLPGAHKNRPRRVSARPARQEFEGSGLCRFFVDVRGR